MTYNLEEILAVISEIQIDQQVLVSRLKEGYDFEILSTENENLPYVELKVASYCRDYGVLAVNKETRGFFPGYKRQFILETNIKPFVMHLTSAVNGSETGEETGSYIGHPRGGAVDSKFLDIAPDANYTRDGSFHRWYDAHPSVNVDDYVRVYRLNQERFRLEV